MDTITEQVVTHRLLCKHFNAYVDVLRHSFEKEYPCADIFMPYFDKEEGENMLLLGNTALKEHLSRLQHVTALDPKMHTLFFGPPGGGKTTAVRIFSQTLSQVVINIRPNPALSAEQLQRMFKRARDFGRSLVFFDEIDRIAETSSAHTAFLQTEMDGMVANEVTVLGATNYRDRIAPALLSRFTTQIYFPILTSINLGLPIKRLFLKKAMEYGPSLYCDGALSSEIQEGTQFGEWGTGLELRKINAVLAYLMGDLARARGSHQGITYLRFQDIAFAFYIKKMQEGMSLGEAPEAVAAGIKTSMAYIRANHSTFFQMTPPLDAVKVSRLRVEITPH